MDDKKKKDVHRGILFSMGLNLIISEENYDFFHVVSGTQTANCSVLSLFLGKTEINLVFSPKNSIIDDETL